MSEENIKNDNGTEENCPLAEMTLMLTLMSRPFGMDWPEDKMIKFLKARGYTIVNRFNENTMLEYCIAVPKDSDFIDEPGKSNIKQTFISEMQDIILEKLLN